VALTKDDIDAVAINLLVDGIHTFQVYLTRGGLTQRRGWSDRADANPVLVKAATDYFEPFMAAVPEALLQRESAAMEDGGREGPRHDWRFELGGGMSSLVYDISYHAGSAGLPDEFADMVVQAERLTHSWYLAGVAEETGVLTGAPAPAGAPPAPGAGGRRAAPTRKSGSATKAPTASRPGARAGRTTSGPFVPASRERIALAILLDFFALGIPYAYAAALFSDGSADGPPGAGLVLFAIAEFVLLVVFRKSLGYWLLGLSAPSQAKPQLDSSWRLRESKLTMAVGVALCWAGASGMTSWTGGQAPIPYFGLPLSGVLSVLMTLLFAAASIAAGVLVLRTETRGVWIGGGVMLVMLLAILLGWNEWDGWVAAELRARVASGGPVSGPEGLGAAQAFARVFLLAAPILLMTGLGFTWKRFAGPVTRAAPVPQATR
jgi:hypothetical protein